MSRVPFQSLTELKSGMNGIAQVSDGRLEIQDPDAFRGSLIDSLIYTVVFGPEDLRPVARWVIRAAAPQFGAYPASIHDLYTAGGRGEYTNATAPAINVRGLTYDQARVILTAAMANDAKIVLFEIARSEMSYTWQKPSEYAACVMAGAIKAGFQGPLFIQGDHFQTVARFYAKDPEGEIKKVRDLTAEAIEAGFYNIDIDASTLVDLELPTLEAQQEINYRITADMTEYIRSLEPEGVTVSIGGEIGEVGMRNSTVEDLHAFMGGYVAELKRRGEANGKPIAGISKISVQTGTSHGGIVLPDGTMAQVNVDFDTLRDLSEAARRDYGLGGAVQHGASTLPAEAFGKFAEADAIEVHLATAFQNQLFDHPAFPAELKARIYAYLDEKCADERKPSQTDAQFYYSSRKRGYGPFKRDMWDMPAETRESILESLQESYALIMQRLGVAGSAAAVDKLVTPVIIVPPAPAELS